MRGPIVNYRPSAAFGLIPTLACAAAIFAMAASHAAADRVPPHLAGMAASLYKAALPEFEKAEPGDSHGWASLRAEEVLRGQDIHRWSAASPPSWTGRRRVAGLLEIDLADADQVALLQSFLLQAQSDGAEAALVSLFEKLGRTVPDPEPLATLVAEIEEALAAGFGELARSHVIETDDGPEVALQWQPEQGKFRIDIEEPGSEFVAPYQTRLEGRLEPVPPSEADAPVEYSLTPAPVPVSTLDVEDLVQIRISVFGEWYDQDGTKWLISPIDGDATNEPEDRPAANPRAALLDRIAAAEAELDEMRGSKVFVWENPETGEREEQERFRRKTDPWEYRGEEMSGEGGAERIAELEREISRLNQELTQGPRVQPAPDLPEPTEDGRVQAIRVAYAREDGSMAVMEQARLDGNRITASRTLDDLRDISSLPDSVIRQLVEEWSPQEWIEFEASVTDDGRTEISGSRWRLHVTYSGDSLKIKSIHTPYARPRNLSRDDRRKAP
ncbi:MAG TPA: hypothetical protein VK862_05080 [Afifellaceae bacterium]|nr:hypothetical protein [Afifellaceae bacterium]